MRSSGRAAASRPEAESGPEPVALEIPVLATGARPGDSAAKRSLFTEETQTVLVFEHGAVIRLSAAVADGQLLFLTNKKTGKEVITQVIRKRSFRPTSCYVDLEFTETSPGFWGVEFPAAGSGSSASARLSETVGRDSAKGNVTPPPDQQEMDRLKNEVAELQTKIKSLIAGGPSADAGNEETSGAQTAAATALNEAAPSEALEKKQEDERALQQLLAQAAAQETLHGPKRLVAYPKKSSVGAVVKKAGKMATAGALAAVVVAAGFASYRLGIFEPLLSKITAAKPAPGHSASVSPKPGMQAPPVTSPQPPANTVGADMAASSSGTPNPAPNSAGDAQGFAPPGSREIVAAVASSPTSKGTLPDAISEPASSSAVVNSKKRPPVDPKHSGNNRAAGLAGISPVPGVAAGNSSLAPHDNGDAVAATEEYVAPKLVHAVKPVSPPDALRNYITGNVNVDALVDTTGQVKSVTVLSGPAKLHSTAIDVMKQYVYEPARKNGKAVASHVQASLQFWYEP